MVHSAFISGCPVRGWGFEPHAGVQTPLAVSQESCPRQVCALPVYPAPVVRELDTLGSTLTDWVAGCGHVLGACRLVRIL